MKARLTLLCLALAATACGGGSAAGKTTFVHAQRGLARVDVLRAHLVVHGVMSLDRTATIERSQLPLERLHLARWARHPRPFACGHGFECARADLDVKEAVGELRPVLPRLPVDPSSLGSAKIEVRVDGRGNLDRVDIAGEAMGARLEVALRPVRS